MTTEIDWLVPWIGERLAGNKNLLALFIGDTGSGKSYSAISLAECLDGNFSAVRIVFEVKAFIALVNSLPAGSVIIFDDAGLGLNAREWQKLTVRIFGMLTQAFRYKQIITLITTPHSYFIERQSRNLLHLRFEATRKPGLMKVKMPFTSPYDEEKVWYKYPSIDVEVNGFIHQMKVETAYFDLASPELLRQYEAKKQEYMDGKWKDFEQELGDAEQELGFMKAGEAARLLGITTATLSDWVRKGKVTPARETEGGMRLFLREEINEFIEQRMKPRTAVGSDSG